MKEHIQFLCNFDVTIQFITAFFFGLSGFNYFQRIFVNKGNVFEEKNKDVFQFFVDWNDYVVYKDSIHIYKLLRFKCYHNVVSSLYVNRFTEIFYKGGMFGLFLLIFIALLRIDPNLSVYRLFPVVCYSFIVVVILARRLFHKIDEKKIMYEKNVNSSEFKLDALIFPFVEIKRKDPKLWYKKIWSLISFVYQFVNPKYVENIKGRSIILRSVIHVLILLTLFHLNWFGLDFQKILEGFHSEIQYVFNDSFLISILPFKNENFKILITFITLFTCFLPYIILFVFYGKNNKIKKTIEKDAKEALSIVKSMKEKEENRKNEIMESLNIKFEKWLDSQTK